jgi:hypothetical protein
VQRVPANVLCKMAPGHLRASILLLMPISTTRRPRTHANPLSSHSSST